MLSLATTHGRRCSFPKMYGFPDRLELIYSLIPTLLYRVIYCTVFPGLYPTLHFPSLGIDGSAKYCYELLTGRCDHVIHAQLQGLDNYKAGEQRRALLDIVVLSRVSIN